MKNLSFGQMEVINGGQTVSSAANPVMQEDGLQTLSSCFWAIPKLALASFSWSTIIGIPAYLDIVRCATT